MPMLTPEQSRAARGWLDWSQEELAKRAHVSLSTVRDFEKGRRTPIKNNLDAMRLSFEIAGISFLFRGDAPLGMQAAPQESAER
jgi:transcriptional regulator with XRE-family HTH domain